MTGLVWAGFVLGVTESNATGDRLSGSPLRLGGVRLSCSQGRRVVGQPGLEEHTSGNRGFSGGDFITYRRILEVWGACLGKTQASCTFQVVAAGGKCMLGNSSDKTLLSLKNGGDTGLLASLCL